MHNSIVCLVLMFAKQNEAYLKASVETKNVLEGEIASLFCYGATDFSISHYYITHKNQTLCNMTIYYDEEKPLVPIFKQGFINSTAEPSLDLSPFTINGVLYIYAYTAPLKVGNSGYYYCNTVYNNSTITFVTNLNIIKMADPMIFINKQHVTDLQFIDTRKVFICCLASFYPSMSLKLLVDQQPIPIDSYFQNRTFNILAVTLKASQLNNITTLKCKLSLNKYFQKSTSIKLINNYYYGNFTSIMSSVSYINKLSPIIYTLLLCEMIYNIG